MKRLVITLLLLTTIGISGYGQNTYQYSIPEQLSDGWKTNGLSAQGFDSTLFYRFFNQLNTQKHQLHSVLLFRDGQLILEEYLNGQARDQPHDLRSSTKSIKSLLMGIAIDKGFVENINDPISKYLKAISPKKNLDPRKEKITIKHLLTMSSGWDCNDWDKKSKGQEDKVYKKKNWLQYTLDLPLINDPGLVSNYCSMGVALTAEIVSQASGMDINEFADKYLFKPLGIENVNWGHTSNKEVIPSAKRLYMTSRDFAKIGQLVLNKGKWGNQQVVSSEWIEEATTPKTKITGLDYGYLWWNIPFVTAEKTFVSKTATGNGGQYIMLIPEKNIMAVFTGGAYNSQDDKLPFAIMKDIFLNSLETKTR